MMTSDDLRTQYGHARIGQAIEYHVGFLMEDREVDLNVHDIANTAYYMACHEGGWLFQRRYSEGVYGYVIVKSTVNRVTRFDRRISRWGAQPGGGAR